MLRTALTLALLLPLALGASFGHFALSAWGDHSIRVQVSGPDVDVVDPPYAPLVMGLSAASSSVRKGDSITGKAARLGSVGTVWTLKSGNLQVQFDDSTGYVTATRVSDGVVLLTQTSLNFGPYSHADNYYTASVSFAPSLVSGEGIYGLGEHRIGRVNLLPSFHKNFLDSQLYSQSSGTDVTMPWYVSTLGYGFLWDLPSYGYFDVGSDTGIVWFSNATQVVDFWITTVGVADVQAPFKPILSHLADAVGHAPAMPYYTTGFIQCKDRYRDQQQLLDVMYGYINRSLPISVIVIDWQHWVNQGDWSFNPVCWPDPQAMVDAIKAEGVEPMVTFWPFQSEASAHLQDFKPQGYLATYGADKELVQFDNGYYLVDETNPGAQEATFSGLWEGYGQYGFRTFWLDAAEPERWMASDDVWNFYGGNDAQIGEAWVQQHIAGLAAGMAEKGYGPSDFMFLARSAWTGTWQWSTALWSGDVQSTFAELELQVRVGQGVAMCGLPLWTTDIGGYSNGDPTDVVFQELIVRWFQFGAFCPLFRLHGHRSGGPASNECGPTNGDNEVWNLAADDDHYNAMATVMRLRENLRPYVVEINNVAAVDGLPMLRPLFLEFPADPVCSLNDGQVDHEYMFGPAFLVSPVTTYGATSWDVYLPQLTSENWVYWFTNTSYTSGQWVNVLTPITEFPLFYRPSLV